MALTLKQVTDFYILQEKQRMESHFYRDNTNYYNMYEAKMRHEAERQAKRSASAEQPRRYPDYHPEQDDHENW